ncbi:MAG: LPS export ABC transporter protein LptC [Spirosomataceae bacterium]|jgi:LPS export ABC transporter protein LptC
MRRIIFILFIGIAFVACKKEEEAKVPFEYTGPIAETTNLNVNFSDSGRTVVKLKTAKQLRFQSEDEVYPKAVYINFIDDTGVEYSSLRGDSGRFIRKENLYKIMGNVFFYNRKEQQSLATELLYWTPRDKRIYTDKKVQINTPSRQVQGVGMESDQDFSRYTIRRPTGIFEVDSLITQPSSNATTNNNQ